MSALFAEAPALPLHSAGKFVAGAYIVFVLILLVYVAIMARRLHGNQRELQELKALLDERDRAAAGLAGPAADAPGSGEPNGPVEAAGAGDPQQPEQVR